MNALRYLVVILVSLPLILEAQQAVQQTGPPIPLTDGSTYLMAPRWSPDGNTIAATSTNYRGIYLISYPDGEINQISDHPAAGFGMQWSHSDEKIATTVAKFQEKMRFNALLVLDSNTGIELLLSDYQTLFPGTPEWTSDDQYIYMKGTDKFKLYNVQSQTRVESPSGRPAPSEFIYSKKGKLYSYQVDAGTEQDIQPVEGQILNLTFSPDGSKIAFEIIGGHLWVANSDGSNPVDLGVGYRPIFSPDGQKITYMITEDNGHEFTSADIYIINVDGSGKTNITNTSDVLEMYPSWSPDGTWIAYSNITTGQIFVQEVE
ncbi:MAG: Protein TolB [Candidatus Marinimicrobia bacterium]|nr:Protein TolB [Candidatus Neomarinimicrobiota bacterium]